MPKIIENLREQLLSEAKKQVKERGYAATTVRSVAKACGLGTGTVYNYFKSKDMLIAYNIKKIISYLECKSQVERIVGYLINSFLGCSG